MRTRFLIMGFLLVAGCGGSSAKDPNPDADGDGILDTAEGRAAAIDTDGDTTPDYLDLDSDDDTIGDAVEAGDAVLATPPVDTDTDTVADFRDQDSDADCVSDESEARGAPPADSDGDGLGDGAEDASCNGAVDSGETSAVDADSDDDGATDLVETAVGTDPVNGTDNPESNGDAVFVAPFQGTQTPADRDLAFATRVRSMDVYVLLDRSGSMAAEITAIKNNLATAIDNVECPPLGAGDPATCIPDLWAGAGAIGYFDSGADAYRNFVDIQPNPSFAALPTTEPSSTTFNEPLPFGAYAAITGQGGSAFSMASVPARATCVGSPAANAGYATFGYPCFRQDALPVVILATDEPPVTASSSTYLTPAWSTVVLPEFLARKARLIGVIGSSPVAGTLTDLQTMATGTGAVDAANGNAPIVLSGADATASAAVQNGILTLANGVPFDLAVVGIDDPADGVDAIGAFVSRFETQQSGLACTGGLADVDNDGDAFKDAYVGVLAGTPVCWKVVAKSNTTVAPTGTAQVFGLSVAVQGDGISELDRRDVLFVVPPAPLD